MREYKLINKNVEVNLADYEDIIKDTIVKIVPDAEVSVLSDRYIIHTEISQSNAVSIGRALARTELGNFCDVKYVLFKGRKIDEEALIK